MADNELVYVDLYGDEVGENDPAAQTKYNRAELKALRKGGFFPKRGDDPKVDAAADDAEELRGSPVFNSGVGNAAAEDDDDAKSVDSSDAPAHGDDADEAKHARRTRAAKD